MKHLTKAAFAVPVILALLTLSPSTSSARSSDWAWGLGGFALGTMVGSSMASQPYYGGYYDYGYSPSYSYGYYPTSSYYYPSSYYTSSYSYPSYSYGYSQPYYGGYDYGYGNGYYGNSYYGGGYGGSGLSIGFGW